MIDQVVTQIVDELNAYVNLRVGVDDRVVQENLVDQDGKKVKDVDDKLVVMLVNVEEDRIFRSVEPLQRQANDTFRRVRPEVKISLYLLFVANLNDYGEALKALAHVISFFQRKTTFHIAEIAAQGEHDGKVVFEMQSPTFEQINHLWGALGAKYRPSVLYKVRLAAIRDAQTEAIVRPVQEVDIVSGMP